MSNLKRACDKIYEISDYEKLVLEAFTKGKEPPLKFSEAEHRNMDMLLSKVKRRKTRKDLMQRKPSFSNTLKKSIVPGQNPFKK